MNNELKKYIETVPAVADFVTEKDKRGKNTEDPGCGEVVRVLFCAQGRLRSRNLLSERLCSAVLEILF